MAEEVFQTARLLVDQDMSHAVSVLVAGGRASAISRRGPGKHGPSEDAALVLPIGDDVGLLAVADGLGGGPQGDRAARWVLEDIREQVLDSFGERSLEDVLIESIERTDRRLRRLGIGAATTISVITLHGSSLRSYHVGDSEVFVIGQRGRVRFHTVPQSPVGRAVKAGDLSAEDALFHEARHIISSAVGIEGMTVEIGEEIELAPNDTVVLTTDGISDNLRQPEIAHLMRRGALKESVEALADMSTRRMEEHEAGQPSKPDDLTCIAFRTKVPAQQLGSDGAASSAP